jgi:putative endonuclease
MDDRAGLGQAGEKQAVKFLRRLRYRIVTRNYRCPQGEIDVVALDGKTIVFVEVKTRTDREHADPQDAVNRAKREHIMRSARFFLRQTGSEDRDFRFDIVAVVRGAGGSLVVEHFLEAFSPSG